MRVLLIDPSDRGGLVSYTALVAEGLRRCGARPVVLGSRVLEPAPAEYPVLRKLPVVRWGRAPRRGPGFFAGRAAAWATGALAAELAARRTRPDVIHFQAPLNRRADAALVRSLRRRAPVVWTAHDVLPFERTEDDEQRFARIYGAVDAVIVHNDAAAEGVRKLAGVEAFVVDHPVRELAPVSREAARARVGLPLEERVLAAVGFVRPYKGYALLADVWESLGPKAPLLLVVGEVLAEEERPVLDRLARSGRAILRLDFAPEETLVDSIAAADALLLPYTESSESGLVHLARAVGTPVLASDQPQLAAAVIGTGAGVTLPRSVEAWRQAVVGELPPPPPAPPSLETVGRSHLELYERVGGGRRKGSAPSGRRPIRLLLYTDATERGGAEHSVAALLPELGAHVDVTVLGVDPGLVEWLAALRPGTRTRVVPPVRYKGDLAPIAAHLRAVRTMRPDVFQAVLRHPWACQYGIAAALLTPGVRVVVVEQATIPTRSALQRGLKRLMSARLDAHVAPGERAARTVERLAGLRPSSVRVIPNTVPDAEVARAPHSDGGFVIGALARLSPEKGLDILLRALAELPEARAVVVGEGPERPRLEALAAGLGVGDRVEFAGWTDDARRHLGSIDALVLPSRSEALPLAAIEAMLARLPVVASDVGSVPEAVLDGETGLLVPPERPDALAAAIRVLIADPERRRRMGDRGRARALERFSPAAAALAFEALYDEVVR